MPKLSDEDRPEDTSDASWDLMKILTSDEPLHPDLADYLEVKEGIEFLRHPLVYQVYGVSYGLANMQYKKKQGSVAKAIAKGDWYTYVFLHERPYRCDALLAVREVGDRLTDERWWRLVGSVWTDSENIWQNFAEWDDILNTDRPERESMMNADERRIFDELPNEITVYRGSVAGLNEGGLSWTTDPAVARFFARRISKDGGQRVIDTGLVQKALVVAYFDGRNENEIVVEHGEAVTITGREEV